MIIERTHAKILLPKTSGEQALSSRIRPSSILQTDCSLQQGLALARCPCSILRGSSSSRTEHTLHLYRSGPSSANSATRTFS
jgi:hypothetical protein